MFGPKRYAKRIKDYEEVKRHVTRRLVRAVPRVDAQIVQTAALGFTEFYRANFINYRHGTSVNADIFDFAGKVGALHLAMDKRGLSADMSLELYSRHKFLMRYEAHTITDRLQRLVNLMITGQLPLQSGPDLKITSDVALHAIVKHGAILRSDTRVIENYIKLYPGALFEDVAARNIRDLQIDIGARTETRDNRVSVLRQVAYNLQQDRPSASRIPGAPAKIRTQQHEPR